MTNPFDDMRAAVAAAEMQLRAADDAADSMVRLLVGRLRHVNSYAGREALKKLKRELHHFNIKTGAWNER